MSLVTTRFVNPLIVDCGDLRFSMGEYTASPTNYHTDTQLAALRKEVPLHSERCMTAGGGPPTWMRAAYLVSKSGVEAPIAFGQLRCYHEDDSGILVGDVDGMYVSPQYRKRGLSQLIGTALIEWSKKNKLQVLCADFHEKNEASKKAFKHLGFKEYKRDILFWYKSDDTWEEGFCIRTALTLR